MGLTQKDLSDYYRSIGAKGQDALKAKYTPEQISELRRKAQRASTKAKLKNKKIKEIHP